jgi:hypothetical protein
MRSRTLPQIAGRVAAVLAVLLLGTGLASAAGVRLPRLPLAATGGATAPDANAVAAPAPAPVGGTPSSGRTVNSRVIRRPRPISATPATRTIRPGGRTTFVIRVQPARTVRSYRLKLWKAPRGITLRLNRRRTRRQATLTVRTVAAIRTGRYTLRVSAWPRRRPGVRRKLKVLRAKLTLVVAVPGPPASGPVGPQGDTAPPGKLFAAGDVAEPLAPGAVRPVNLVLTNALATAVDVTGLTATVTSVTPAPGGACTQADFATLPATLSAPLRLEAQSSRTLLALGLPRSAWPAVSMIDRPVSQDGCKGAAVALRFDVEGREPT